MRDIFQRHREEMAADIVEFAVALRVAIENGSVGFDEHDIRRTLRAIRTRLDALEDRGLH